MYTELKDWNFVEVQGPEARDFLHRITSADFRNLAVGESCDGTLLTPTGKILLYFWAVALEQNQFLLISPKTFAAPEQALEKLHFMENLKVTLLQPGEWSAFRTSTGVAAGKDRSSLETSLRDSGEQPDPTPELSRILSGEPTAPNEISADVLPLEVGLDRAVHENKGCYPGQEVIERIRSMGQAPRKLLRVSGEGPTPQLPSPLETNAGQAGTLTSAVSSGDNQWVGLALVKKAFVAKLGEERFAVAGRSVTLKP